MRKIVITLFIISITTVIFISVKNLNKLNDIDYLQSIAIKTQEYTSSYEQLFYFSNSLERELLFKTQFAFTPKQIIKKHINKISESDILLVVIDKRKDSTGLSSLKDIKFSDTIYMSENSYFKIMLLNN